MLHFLLCRFNYWWTSFWLHSQKSLRASTWTSLAACSRLPTYAWVNCSVILPVYKLGSQEEVLPLTILLKLFLNGHANDRCLHAASCANNLNTQLGSWCTSCFHSIGVPPSLLANMTLTCSCVKINEGRNSISISCNNILCCGLIIKYTCSKHSTSWSFK